MATGRPGNGGPPRNANVTDKAGDTVVNGRGEAKAEARADIVASHLSYLADAVVFAVKTAQPGDPAHEPNWSSDSTYVTWELDATGDGKPDYEVQFFLSDGAPAAGVSRVGDSEVASVCEAEAVYTLERYAVGFDPECIGRPAGLSYRVTMYYDTDPKNEDADVLTDVAPDGGLARPVPRP